MSPSLPAAPSLEQLRKRAKDLRPRAGHWARQRVGSHHRSGERSSATHSSRASTASRAGRELTAYVERVAAHGPDLQHAYHEDLDYYDERADGLLPRRTTAPPAPPPRSRATTRR